MAIVKRRTRDGRERFYVRYVAADDPTGRMRTSRVLDTREEAEAFERDLVARGVTRRARQQIKRVVSGEALGLDPGRSLGPEYDTDDAFAAWAERRILANRRVSEATRAKYLAVVRQHLAGTDLGRLDVHAVREEDVQRFWDGLDVGDGARRNIKQVLSLLLRSGLRSGEVTLLLDRLDLTVARPNRIEDADPLRADQIWALAEAATCPRDRVAILLMGFAGLRESEVGALRAADVDLERCRILFRQHIDGLGNMAKGRKWNPTPRPVGLAPALCEEVRRYIAQTEPTADGRIFYKADGGLWKHGAINAMVHATAARVPSLRGLHIHGHLLRHSAASLLAEEGGSVREVQDLLGDRSEAAALRYVHRFEDTHTAVSERMARVYARRK